MKRRWFPCFRRAPTSRRPSLDVRALRNRSQLTQVEFAERLGVPLETIRNWEQGKREPRGPARALAEIDRAGAGPHLCAARESLIGALMADACDFRAWQARAAGGMIASSEPHQIRRGTCRSSKRAARGFRPSGLEPGSCAAAPAPASSSRRCGSAIATSTRRKCTTMSARSARAFAPPARRATRCSSPQKSGRRISRRTISSAR